MKIWKEEPAKVLGPRTLAEIYGKERVLVEQHRGILSYADDCIRIGATFGALVVTGGELRLCCMSRSQLVIRGRIRSVEIMEGSEWS